MLFNICRRKAGFLRGEVDERVIERGYAKLSAYQGADFASARAVLALDADNPEVGCPSFSGALGCSSLFMGTLMMKLMWPLTGQKRSKWGSSLPIRATMVPEARR